MNFKRCIQRPETQRRTACAPWPGHQGEADGADGAGGAACTRYDIASALMPASGLQLLVAQVDDCTGSRHRQATDTAIRRHHQRATAVVLARAGSFTPACVRLCCRGGRRRSVVVGAARSDQDGEGGHATAQLKAPAARDHFRVGHEPPADCECARPASRKPQDACRRTSDLHVQRSPS